MKLDKKQLPQLMVLGLLVIACVGYVSFTMFKPKQSKSQVKPAAEAGQTNKADAVSKRDSESGTEWRTVLAGVFPNLMATLPRRDPFVPQIVADLHMPGVKPPGTVVTPRVKVPPMNPMDNPFLPGRQVVTPIIQLPVQKDPDFVLTGVVRGDQNVAIIRGDGGGRYIVKQGQLIDGRYKVLYIANDGAVLAYKGRRIHLKLGGATNAS